MNRRSGVLPVALTIAGYDPSGAAGILADVRTFYALNVYAYAVPTCITIQNFENVKQVESLSPMLIVDLLNHLRPTDSLKAVKLGLVPGMEIYKTLLPFLKNHSHLPIVCDPVIRSSSGFPFLDDEDLTFLKKEIFPLITLLTPNLPELETLSEMTIHSEEDIAAACRSLQQYGETAILVKGGHAKNSSHSTDFLFLPDNKDLLAFTGRRIHAGSLRGTGCTLSSAISAFLAKGENLIQALRKAKEFITTVLDSSKDLKWNSTTGPLWPF